MKSFLMFAIVVLLAVPGQARLGDSLNELKRRYGQPMDADNTKEAGAAQYSFNWNQYAIIVTLQDGFSVAEEYTRRNGRDFTLQEVNELLKESSPGLAWTQVDGSTWKQRDRRASWTGKSLLVEEKQRAR